MRWLPLKKVRKVIFFTKKKSASIMCCYHTIIDYCTDAHMYVKPAMRTRRYTQHCLSNEQMRVIIGRGQTRFEANMRYKSD